MQDLLGTKPHARNVISSYISSRFSTTGSSSSSNPPSRNAGPSRSGGSTPQPLSGKPIIRQAPPKKPKPADPAGGSMLSDSLGGGSARAVKPEVLRKEQEEPKSAEVERIEALMKNAELSGPDGDGLGKRALKKGRSGGCFCQGSCCYVKPLKFSGVHHPIANDGLPVNSSNPSPLHLHTLLPLLLATPLHSPTPSPSLSLLLLPSSHT